MSDDPQEGREALLRHAEAIAKVGSWMWDPATGDVTWSDQCFRVLGFDPASATPSVEAFFARIHPDDMAEVQEGSDAVARGEHREVEARLVHPDGTLRVVRLSSKVVHRSDGTLRIVGTLLDITEQKALEARLLRAERMEALGRVAAGIAHDFNNYLTMAMSSCDWIADQLPEDHPAHARADALGTATRRWIGKTDELLDFARQPAPPEIFDLAELLRSGEALTAGLLDAGVDLDLDLTDEPAPIRADAGQVERALVNLVANARDAMPDGGAVEVRLRIEGDEVHLSVHDTGKGIREAELARVFEPFYTTKPQGTGLGLATVWTTAQRAGGRVGVQSSPRGTTFTMVLPLASRG